VYEKLHTAMAEKIPAPDLLVYLRADLDTLMARIAMRDRPYERGMDRSYIDSLRLAYEGFFTAYAASPVLVIDTNNLNIVADPQAYADVRERIRSALGGTFQQALLQVPAEAPTTPKAIEVPPLSRDAHTLRDFAALTQSIGNLGAILSDGADRTSVHDALSICLRRLTHVAEATGVKLEE
jgi:deoxyguanosine kinase